MRFSSGSGMVTFVEVVIRCGCEVNNKSKKRVILMLPDLTRLFVRNTEAFPQDPNPVLPSATPVHDLITGKPMPDGLDEDEEEEYQGDDEEEEEQGGYRGRKIESEEDLTEAWDYFNDANNRPEGQHRLDEWEEMYRPPLPDPREEDNQAKRQRTGAVLMEALMKRKPHLAPTVRPGVLG